VVVSHDAEMEMPDHTATLRRIRVEFLGRLRAQLCSFEALAETLANEPVSGSRLVGVRRNAHKIAGVAGSVGFVDLGNTARKLDELLNQAMREREVGSIEVKAIVAATNELCQACANALATNET